LREFDGYVDIEYDEDEGITIIEDKVVLSLQPDEDLEE
jgi:hypothetical protein